MFNYVYQCFIIYFYGLWLRYVQQNHRARNMVNNTLVHLPCGRKDPKGARSEQLLYVSVLHFQYYSTILKKDVAS